MKNYTSFLRKRTIPGLSLSPPDPESHPPHLARTSESGKPSMTGDERVAVQASHSRRFKKRKRVKLKRSRGKRREHAIVSPLVKKYWLQRYQLFSKYDEGVKLDEEGWYSVTPEEIAISHAERCRGRTVIDCFAGVGGNAIQFAILCHHVVAIDIDPQKIALAFHNAKVYGVADRIDFVVGDFFQLAPSLKGDIAYLSPPWGGPSYKMIQQFNLDLLKPKDGKDPQIEENYVDGNFKGITAYFSDVASRQA
ncbi:trimethylguanosine synthase-like isoform X2 [Rhodamnia argentea]|uniref:Trimethylguanosine synthase n=1 Tax=Rhodamnia argentea TaxID=178133 RepID=A0ABM3HSK0_9MYRT|nr:trimethylguanosine synthase-like isoform X2 [Rhodamnia argentea]